MEKTRVLNHPAHLMPREPKLALQNNNDDNNNNKEDFRAFPQFQMCHSTACSI